MVSDNNSRKCSILSLEFRLNRINGTAKFDQRLSVHMLMTEAELFGSLFEKTDTVWSMRTSAVYLVVALSHLQSHISCVIRNQTSISGILNDIGRG